MLTLFVGNDSVRAKKEATKLARGSEVVRFGEGGETFEAVMGYLGQRGMFTPSVALILDHPLDTLEGELLVEEHLADFASAEAKVMIIEDSLTAAIKKKIPKAATIEQFDFPEQKQEVPPPSVFTLTDAYALGDRKRTWVTYRTLIGSGVQPEEVHGALAWAVRSMILAAKTKTPQEAGMKDYPYRKAQQAVKKIGLPAAETLSTELVTIYHHARMGRGDLEDLVEMFLLKK